ncbi:flagella basal body P-ring formation protein FlgA, partial [Erythrobacter sp.]|uniref:flagella basal body P-ring formation protein FlgA n=1 Tax=Erythrobacter sp. TaxID=1042 RepID=UPI002EAE45AC|nr:flagella basal body P-ring formation protein FlgA [Erythrobacter sp.]
PADRRLRLASCAVPLDVAWHGRAKASVRVACPGPQAWQIFIALRTPAPAERAAPAIARGDPLTIQIRGRGFTIQKPGEAMEAGGVGECIAVSTGRGSETLRARIERPGLAVIPAG